MKGTFSITVILICVCLPWTISCQRASKLGEEKGPRAKITRLSEPRKPELTNEPPQQIVVDIVRARYTQELPPFTVGDVAYLKKICLESKSPNDAVWPFILLCLSEKEGVGDFAV